MKEGFSTIGVLKRNAKPFLFIAAVFAAAGIALMTRLPVSLFPDITFPRLTILADNREQPIERMQAEVTQPLEEAASSVPGVTRVRSITGRGSTEISVFLEWGTDVSKAFQMLQGRVSDIRNVLPPTASVQTEQMNVAVFPVEGYSLASDTRDLVELRDMAYYRIRPALMRIPGVARVEITGGRSREYLVVCDPDKLRSYGITPQQVSDAVSRASRITSTGLLEDNHQIYLTLATNSVLGLEDIRAVTVAVKDGVPVPVSSIAEVKSAVQDVSVRTAAQGKEAVLISVLKQPAASTVRIGQAIQERLALLDLPKDVRVENSYDQGDFIRSSIASTRDSIVVGILLAMVILFLFLRSARLTLVAALVVPGAVAGTFVCLKLAGQTINIMTLGGIAAAVGLIIDDSIVVIEGIFIQFGRKINEGEAAIGLSRAIDLSLKEMLPAILGSSASTIVIFLPLAFLGGLTGSFFAPLSITMAFALGMSFVLSITLTPLLASKFIRSKDIEWEAERESRPSIVAKRFEFFLRLLLRRSWIVLPMGGLLIALTVLIYTKVGTGFLPSMDEGTFVLDYESPPGTSLAETDRMLGLVEKILIQIPEVQSYSRRTGTQLGFFLTEPNRGDYLVKLKKARKRHIEEVVSEVRTRIEASQPSLRVDFGQLMQDVIGDLASNPSPIEVKIFGDDRKILWGLAKEIKDRIESVRGVVDAFDGIVISGPSFLVHVDGRKAAQAGFAPGEVEDALGIIQRGRTESWIQKGEKLIPVRVRYPDAYRRDMNQVKKAVLITALGVSVPLAEVASFEMTPGQAEWNREGLRPVVSVTARIEGRDLGSTVAEIRAILTRDMRLPAGVFLEFGGLYRNQQESFRGLLIVALAAILLVCSVLLIEFRNFTAPASILFITLLAVSGVVAALWITGVDFNVSSFVGLIMIIGIVAENAVFIVHYIQVFKSRGMGIDEAIVQSTLLRSRPILMTTLAAVSALLPLSLGIGAGSQMQQPLAIAVIGGFSVSGFLLLFGLPMAYRLLNRR